MFYPETSLLFFFYLPKGTENICSHKASALFIFDEILNQRCP